MTIDFDLFLLRHAEPDLSTGIAYDEPPGPGLSATGHAQAAVAAAVLAPFGLVAIHASPFQRARDTAAALAARIGAAVTVHAALGEWHGSETASVVVARVQPLLDRLVAEGAARGPVCAVSHGGTIGVMLRKLGMPRAEVDTWRQRYGGMTPLPVSGVWHVRGRAGGRTFALLHAPADAVEPSHRVQAGR